VRLQAVPLAGPLHFNRKGETRKKLKTYNLKHKTKKLKKNKTCTAHLKSSENRLPRKITKRKDTGLQEDGKCDAEFYSVA
jgi:hypothetical protein